jgi:hypothetical protein
MTVYSQLLWAGSPSLNPETVFSPSSTAVVRDMEVYNGDSNAHELYAALLSPGFPETRWLYITVPATSSWQWQGRVVVPAGGGLVLWMDNADFSNVVVSGYVFQ